MLIKYKSVASWQYIHQHVMYPTKHVPAVKQAILEILLLGKVMLKTPFRIGYNQEILTIQDRDIWFETLGLVGPNI